MSPVETLTLLLLASARKDSDGPTGDPESNGDDEGDGGNGEGNDGSGEGGGEDDEGGEDDGSSGGHGGDRDGDPVGDGPGTEDREPPKPHEPVVSPEHPLGDYAGAFFDYARDLAHDLADKYKEAATLRDLFDEAAHARDVWSALREDRPLTSGDDAPTLLAEEAASRSYLLEDYQRLGLFAAFYGMSITSDTGGSHNPLSAHYQHKAVDVNVQGVSRSAVERFMWFARTAGLYVRDERGQPLTAKGEPQTPWSNPHVHVQTSEPRPGVSLDRFSQPPFVRDTFMRFRKP